MSTKHSLTLGIERVAEQPYVVFKAVGVLTHDDYVRLEPFVTQALGTLSTHGVRVLFDASSLEGWEFRAAWDDFRLGLKHGSEFEKIAIFAHQHWMETAAKVSNWFTSGEVRYFENYNDAVNWLIDK